MTDAKDLIQQICAAGLCAPERMTLMITDGCNLHCRHCWLDCRPHGRAVPVAVDTLSRIIDDFARLGGRHVNLTGGELLTHPDWPAILRFGLQHPALTGVCLQTNATLITRGQIDRLLDLPAAKLTLKVSLDGAGPRVHDRIRGSGSFDKAMAGLKRLVKAGFGPRTRVAFTEMADNFQDLPRLLALVDEMGLDRLVGNALVKGGRAAAWPPAQLPTCDQYRQLIRRYQSDPLFQSRCDEKASIAAIEWFKHRRDSIDQHCSCIKDLFVDSHGRLYPCPMLLVDALAAPGLHERPMDQVIMQALATWREIPVCSRNRQQMLTDCATCLGHAHCGGGCIGRALVVGGDWMAVEDRCALRRTVYE